VGLVYLGAILSGFFFAPEFFWGGNVPPLWIEVEQTVGLVSYAGVPVAIGFAVLRCRLYDIDVVINCTLVYGSLTATLAGIYLGGVVVLQYLFRTLAGQESQLVVVASTLAIAALLVTLRRRVRGFVDRRFYGGSTTPPGPCKPSPPGCATRRTWTGWTRTWWAW
jgi:hypothetical protein